MLILACLLGMTGATTEIHAAEQHLPPAGKKNPGIRLGMSTALSGPASDLGWNMRHGVLAGIRRINEHGGVNGSPLSLVNLDDGYEPDRTVPNMNHLINKAEVLAVVGNVGTPTAMAALPLVNATRTPFIAPFTGAGVLRKQPPDPSVFNFRASYAEEIRAMVDALTNAGVSPREIAFFTQRDGYGDSGYFGGLAALRARGLDEKTSPLHVRYERNTLAVEHALAALLATDPLPRAVIMVGAYAPCAKFIRLARELALNIVFLNVSFVGGDPLAQDLQNTGEGVIVTQVVPHPQDQDAPPVVRAFHEDLQRWNPHALPTHGALEGYLAMRVLEEAFKGMQAPPSRENLITALKNLGTFDIGMGYPLALSATDHQASHHVWPTIIKNGRIEPFHWESLAGLLPDRTPPATNPANQNDQSGQTPAEKTPAGKTPEGGS